MSKPETTSTRTAHATQTDVSVIVRALNILDLFEQGSGPLSMMAIAQKVGLHKATAFRLLTTLVHDHLLCQTASGDYELGFFAPQRASVVRESDTLWRLARPIMTTLRDRLNESVVFTRRFGDDCVDLDLVQATTAVMQAPVIGRRVALHDNIGGCAILASQTPDEFERYVRSQVRSGKKKAAVLNACSMGRSAIAEAIRDMDGNAVATIWLTIAPGRVIASSELQEALRQACAEHQTYTRRCGSDNTRRDNTLTPIQTG